MKKIFFACDTSSINTVKKIPKLRRNDINVINKLNKEINTISLLKHLSTQKEGQVNNIKILPPNYKPLIEKYSNIDFTNQSFPYSEFPNGLEIEFYDEIEGTTTVSSDYGIVYYQTRIVSLEGNVTIKSPDSSFVKSEQIYWDPEQEWLFSEKKVLFSSDDYTIRAKRLDADRSFKLLKTGKLDGNFLFTEN